MPTALSTLESGTALGYWKGRATWREKGGCGHAEGPGALGFLSLGDSAFCFDGAIDSLPSRKRSRKRKPRTSLHPAEVLKSSTERSLQGMRPRSQAALDPPKPDGRHPRGRGVQHAGRAAASPPASGEHGPGRSSSKAGGLGASYRQPPGWKRGRGQHPHGPGRSGHRVSIRECRVCSSRDPSEAWSLAWVRLGLGVGSRPRPSRVRARAGRSQLQTGRGPASGVQDESGARGGAGRDGSEVRVQVRVPVQGSSPRLESGIRGPGSVRF